MKTSSTLTLDEYQKLAARTAGAGGDGDRRLVISALGLAGEAGEFANMVKKMTAHGHSISPETLADELGDVLWYAAAIATELGTTLSDVAQKNLDKLFDRHERNVIKSEGDNR